MHLLKHGLDCFPRPDRQEFYRLPIRPRVIAQFLPNLNADQKVVLYPANLRTNKSLGSQHDVSLKMSYRYNSVHICMRQHIWVRLPTTPLK